MSVAVPVIVIALFLIFSGLLVYTRTRTRSRRSVTPPSKPAGGDGFEIITWQGRTPPPVAGVPRTRRTLRFSPPARPSVAQVPKTRRTRNFSEPTRWQNPEALCLLTGRRAADCSCETHRSLA
jgi:hypothetical protein